MFFLMSIIPMRVILCTMNHAINHGIEYLNPAYVNLLAPIPNNTKPSNFPVISNVSILFPPI